VTEPSEFSNISPSMYRRLDCGCEICFCSWNFLANRNDSAGTERLVSNDLGNRTDRCDRSFFLVSESDWVEKMTLESSVPTFPDPFLLESYQLELYGSES